MKKCVAVVSLGLTRGIARLYQQPRYVENYSRTSYALESFSDDLFVRLLLD